MHTCMCSCICVRVCVVMCARSCVCVCICRIYHYMNHKCTEAAGNGESRERWRTVCAYAHAYPRTCCRGMVQTVADVCWYVHTHMYEMCIHTRCRGIIRTVADVDRCLQSTGADAVMCAIGTFYMYVRVYARIRASYNMLARICVCVCGCGCGCVCVCVCVCVLVDVCAHT
jgi:hypothetical protein